MLDRFALSFSRHYARRFSPAAVCAVALTCCAAVFAANENAPRVNAAREVENVSIASVAKANSPRIVRMEVTAYCACKKCCGKQAHGVTASGKLINYNNGAFVAADTGVLPFGTKLLIPGYGGELPVEVIDRGGAIKGNRLDVYFPTHAEALKWGRQKLAVLVLE